MLQLNVRCHYTLMNRREEKREEKVRRRGQSCHKNKRTCGEKREKRRRAEMAADEEDAFRNGLGQVCGEPVARR